MLAIGDQSMAAIQGAAHSAADHSHTQRRSPTRAQPRRQLDGDEAAREAQRIRAVDDWPRGPLLHLRRYLGEYDLEFGLIFAPDLRNAATTIRVFARPTSVGPSDEAAVVASYATVEDLVVDGWMID
jgi:hypothetical protein